MTTWKELDVNVKSSKHISTIQPAEAKVMYEPSHTACCEKKPQTPKLKLDILGTSPSSFRANWEDFFLRTALKLMISYQCHPILGPFT